MGLGDRTEKETAATIAIVGASSLASVGSTALDQISHPARRFAFLSNRFVDELPRLNEHRQVGTRGGEGGERLVGSSFVTVT